jgi:hypothetical protein
MAEHPRGAGKPGGEESPSPSPSYVDLIGPALKTVRVLQGKSQVWVAECLTDLAKKKVDQAYVSKVEAGKCHISRKRWDVWCQVLNCDPLAVLTLAKSMAKPRRKKRRRLASASNGHGLHSVPK